MEYCDIVHWLTAGKSLETHKKTVHRNTKVIYS